MLVYRNTETQIHFDNRIQFGQPFFILIDKLWETVNLRNGSVPVREVSYIFGIPFFNEDVIREVANNAFAHRSYRINREIVVKQYPMKLTVINAGGFPKGVTIDNLLTTSSIPRNRLLADILAKTGLVERSGQGMDKIFLNTLSEGKPEPGYTESDDFNVTAILSATVKDKAFAMYVQGIQQSLPEEKELTVIYPFLKKYGKAKRTDINKIVGDHLSQKQLRRFLDSFKANGMLETEGQTNQTVYYLGKNAQVGSNNLPDSLKLDAEDAPTE